MTIVWLSSGRIIEVIGGLTRKTKDWPEKCMLEWDGGVMGVRWVIPYR